MKINNKKVLLRERKRHTAGRVVSTPSVVLPGSPPCPNLAGGVPYLGTPPRQGTPPSWPGGYPAWVPSHPGPGVPYLGTPSRVPPGREPPQQGTPPQGTPPLSWTWLGTPPPNVCPVAFWVMLQSTMGYGYPPPPLWTDRLMDGWTDTCQNITFPSYYVRGR